MGQNFFKTNRAASIMEYMALLLFFMAALYVFQPYVLNAISGGWKKAGDVFGAGKQYDPRSFGATGEGHGTLECFFENTHCKEPHLTPSDPGCTLLKKWVSTSCFRTTCDCTLPSDDPDYLGKCWDCLDKICSEDQYGYCQGG